MLMFHACTTAARSRTSAPIRRLHAAICTSLALASGHAAASDLSGNATATTDYVWRGTTQSDGDPTLQAGLKLSGLSLTGTPGSYVSAWASGVAFPGAPGASSELDLVAGWSGELSPQWSADVNITRYRYPDSAVDLDWTELNGSLSWNQDQWLQVGYSRHALAGEHPGIYAQIGARRHLDARLRVEAAAGRYWFDGLDSEGRTHGGYRHLQLGAVWAFAAPLELRVTLHATDDSARQLFPGLAGTRIEGALQATF